MSRKYNSLFDIRRSGDAINKITVERDALKAELASFKAYDNELEDILVDAAEEKVTYYGRSDSAERCKCNWCGQEDFFRSCIKHLEHCPTGRIEAALDTIRSRIS